MQGAWFAVRIKAIDRQAGDLFFVNRVDNRVDASIMTSATFSRDGVNQKIDVAFRRLF